MDDRLETQPPHWWVTASDAFDAWLAKQPDNVRECMGLLEQIDLYAAYTKDNQ